MLIRVNLESLDVSVGARHHHDNNISYLTDLQDSQGISPIDLNKYKSLLLAAHVGRAARVRT